MRTARLQDYRMGTEHESRLKSVRDAAAKLLAADYFAALGVSRTASAEDVKQAFLELVKTWHPDRVPRGLEELRPLFQKAFGRLELARATVSDPTRRARYIEDLASSGDVSAAESTLELRKAEALLKKNDAVGAEKHLRRAVQLAPTNAEAQVLLVWLQVKPDSSLARLRELVADLDRLIGRGSTIDRAYFYRGQLRKRLDLLKEAHADFLKASDLNPNAVDAVREVRIYKMRQEKAAPTTPTSDEGVGGFFKKLFKR